MTPVEKIAPPEWMAADDTVRLIDALTAGGADIRFVGGCVRDAVLNRAVMDVDLATDAEPPRVLELLAVRNIRAVPTGIDHGTVTAIPDHRPFEITTLRTDAETDGRHAQVRYTTDWAEDAARRDFTINALSADPDGNIYDYVDGLADLRAGRVRFIGDPGERLAEDHLRILRFFRFQAIYASGEPDAAALEACLNASGKVGELSGERIWQELSRILNIPGPGKVFTLMEDARVLSVLFPVGRSSDRLQALAALEGMVGMPPDPVRRLAALIQPNRREASQIATRLRLSRPETARLDELVASRGGTSAGLSELGLRRALYAMGQDVFRDLVLLDWADQVAREPAVAAANTAGWKATWDVTTTWTPPEFPLSGQDVIAAGVEEGPDVGKILADIEEWWVDHAFRPAHAECLDRLRLVMRRR